MPEALRAPAIPFVDLSAQYASIREEVREAFDRVLSEQRFIGGDEVTGFEAELARACGASHAIGCASGSDALLLSLMACGIGPGDAVLCPAYTFFATAGAVARLGARPVFADVDARSFMVDAETLERASARAGAIRAVIPVHLFGRAAPIAEIRAWGGARGVPVIEDAAQAIGARDAEGRPVGAGALAAGLSFFPAKNLGAYGDAGAILCSSAELAERLRALRTHGARRKYYHDEVGLNSRLDALQAAVLRVKLRHLEAWLEARRANAAHYDACFAAAGAAREGEPAESDGLPLRTPTPVPSPARAVFHQYVVRVPAPLRDALRGRLAERGIASEVYYPRPLHLQRCFAALGHREGDLPVSERLAEESLALPVYPELGARGVERVADDLVSALSELQARAGRRRAQGPNAAAPPA